MVFGSGLDMLGSFELSVGGLSPFRLKGWEVSMEESCFDEGICLGILWMGQVAVCVGHVVNNFSLVYIQ